METDFFPKGYEVPKAPSNFMKLDEDTNKFRALSAPIMGWLYWTADRKPMRLKERPDTMPEDARDGDKLKHFWALVVWNYAEKRVQLLEITQSTIQNAIRDLAFNEDWGDPKEFDITVTGKGEGLERKYTVQPSPHKPAPVEALAAYRAMRINLEALYEGGDPFAGGEREDAGSNVTREDTPFS